MALDLGLSPSGRRSTRWSLFIVVVAVFPFYYAILTSFKSGTDLFRVTYWPTSFSLGQLRGGAEHRQLPAQPAATRSSSPR